MPDFIKDNHLYHNPVEFALKKIGGSYKMPVLWRLKNERKRYAELKKSLPHVSDRMLSLTLNELLNDGFIFKEVYAEVPPRVEYYLTARGEDSLHIIEVLRNYGLQLMAEFNVQSK